MDTPRLIAARIFAMQIHGNQRYGENKPYVYHLDKVCEVLRRFGFNEEKEEDLFVAALLHDSQENQEISIFALLEAGFSERAVVFVHAVNDERGQNRIKRHQKTYGKIASTMDAIVLKLSDRIANAEEGEKIDMYRKEHLDFIRALAQSKTTYPIRVADMWDHFNKLIQNPTQNK